MNTLSWIIDGSFSTRLTLALLHFLWQGCCGGLLVAVCGALFRNTSARFRYTLNVATLILMAACLPVTFLLVEIPVAGDNQSAGLPNVNQPETGERALDKHQTSSVARIDPLAPELTGSRDGMAGSIATPDAGPTAAKVVASSASSDTLLETGTFQSLSRWVATLYLSGVALVLARLLCGVWGGRRLRKIANVIDDAPLLELVNKLARRLGLKVVPAVAWCGQIAIPVVVGIVKPMILLPTAVVSGLTPDQLQALLLHELAHIRRFDPIVNLLQRIIEAVLFFHPVVWFVSRRISIMREHAADDMVLAAGWDRPLYADALLRAAELASALSCPDLALRATVLGASGTSQSEFKVRVLRLVEESHAPKLQLSRAGVLALLMVVALGGMLAWSQTHQSETASDRSDRIDVDESQPGDAKVAPQSAPDALPNPENERRSLINAVRDFNAKNKTLGRGQDQRPLTEEEVIAAIEHLDWRRDVPQSSQAEFAKFKKIAETRRLPEGSEIELLASFQPDAFTLIQLWSIRIIIPALERPGTTGFTVRDTKIREEKIDAKSVAWGKPDSAGLSLGLYLAPKKDKYQIGDRVQLRLFVRNQSQQPVDGLTFMNITWPKTKDFTVTDPTGAHVAVRNGHEDWSGKIWVAGASKGALGPGDVHALRVPFEVGIGGAGSNKLVGRVIDARAGQTLQVRVRAFNGNDRKRAKDAPEPESGSITLTVEHATGRHQPEPGKDKNTNIDPNGEIVGRLMVAATGKPVAGATVASNHFLVSFHETPWKDVLLWYGRVMGKQIQLKVLPPGNFSYNNPRPLNHSEIIQLINGALLRRGYCLAESGDQLSVQPADVVARQYENALRGEFMHGHKLRQGPAQFDSYFKIVDVRVVGATKPPAPSGPAIAYVLKANRDFSAQEATAFWRSCIFDNSLTSLKTGQPVVVDGFAVLYNGKWLGTNVPALKKGERIEIWQNNFEEWNARPPSDMRVVIEGRIVEQGGKSVSAHIRQFLMEGVPEGTDEKLGGFLNGAFGGELIVDQQGKFQVALRHGTQFVRTAYLYAFAPGYAPQRVGPIAVGYEKPAAPLTIELQPGITGRLRLVQADGKPLEEGEVEVFAQDDLQADGFRLAKLPIDGKPIDVRHCPPGPLLLKVRVPGFAEQVIRDVRLLADQAADVKVPRGKRTR